jgi:taurine dioxygenase
VTREVLVEPVAPALGAVVRGAALDEPLSDALRDTIRAALDRYLVLFFPGQALNPVQQRDFAASFGTLYRHPFYDGEPEAPEIMVLDHDATHRPNSDRWHNDATYLATPPEAGILFADIIPALGGDTLWSNTYAAYEALSEPMRAFVATLRAQHSFAKNFTPERFAETDMEDRRSAIYAAHPPVTHPVARTNPVTGRRALFVNADFTTHVEGLSAAESAALLRTLYEHMAKPEFSVRWRWTAGDVVFWDNRWAQHYALADYYPERRRVRRATIVGGVPV